MKSIYDLKSMHGADSSVRCPRVYLSLFSCSIAHIYQILTLFSMIFFSFLLLLLFVFAVAMLLFSKRIAAAAAFSASPSPTKSFAFEPHILFWQNFLGNVSGRCQGIWTLSNDATRSHTLPHNTHSAWRHIWRKMKKKNLLASNREEFGELAPAYSI